MFMNAIVFEVWSNLILVGAFLLWHKAIEFYIELGVALIFSKERTKQVLVLGIYWSMLTVLMLLLNFSSYFAGHPRELVLIGVLVCLLLVLFALDHDLSQDKLFGALTEWIKRLVDFDHWGERFKKILDLLQVVATVVGVLLGPVGITVLTIIGALVLLGAIGTGSLIGFATTLLIFFGLVALGVLIFSILYHNAIDAIIDQIVAWLITVRDTIKDFFDAFAQRFAWLDTPHSDRSGAIAMVLFVFVVTGWFFLLLALLIVPILASSIVQALRMVLWGTLGLSVGMYLLFMNQLRDVRTGPLLDALFQQLIDYINGFRSSEREDELART